MSSHGILTVFFPLIINRSKRTPVCEAVPHRRTACFQNSDVRVYSFWGATCQQMSNTKFVSNLSTNPAFARPKTHTVVSKARMSIISGGVTLAFALTLLAKAHRDKRKRNEEPEEYMTMEAMDKRINKIRDIQIKTDMFSGLSIVIGAAMTILRYKPSNVESSQAALLKYLRIKGVVEDDFIQVLKNVRPYRIKTLKI